MKKFWESILAIITAIADFARKPEPTPSQKYQYPWMEFAFQELGQSEVLGSKHNKRILEYHQATSLKATEDEIPWCSSFVNWVFLKCKMKRTNSASARSWLKWGIELEQPIEHCVVIFKRGNSDWQGHVGFYLGGHGTGLIRTLGGNQSDKVKISNYYETTVLGYRWPSDYPLPKGAKVKQ